VRSPFLWRHLVLLAGLVANGVLSGVSLVKGHTAVRAWALPLGIAVRAATFVYLLLSLFAVLLGLEVFTALEWEYDWRPHDAWPQIQPGMTRRQVVALLGPPQSHIRFEYGYLLWPLAYSQGTLTFTGDPATLHDPLVDTIHGSSIANLKELRPGTVRILFAFDPWRDSILLVAGDKAGRWTQWYREAIPLAEQRYERYLKERHDEEEHQR